MTGKFFLDPEKSLTLNFSANLKSNGVSTFCAVNTKHGSPDLPFLLIQLGSAKQPSTAPTLRVLCRKYPTQKSNLGSACKLWINVYYKSIADIVKHTPVLTYYIYNKAHRFKQGASDLPPPVSTAADTAKADKLQIIGGHGPVV